MKYDVITICKIAKILKTLIDLGRDRNKAICDVAQSYGLTKSEVILLAKLV